MSDEIDISEYEWKLETLAPPFSYAPEQIEFACWFALNMYRSFGMTGEFVLCDPPRGRA